MAAPVPEEEPQALRFNTLGFFTRPPTPDQPEIERVERMLAHSERLVLPRMMAPASVRRLTTGASRPVTLFARASEPAVVAVSSADLDVVLDQDRHAVQRAAWT